MGEKDIAQKNFEAYNDVVADIVNGSLFDGSKAGRVNMYRSISQSSILTVF